MSTIDGSGKVVEAVDVFPLLADCDLIKIDIEGAEWEILQDPRFADLRASHVILEYHPRLCPADDPQALAQHILEASGYRITKFRPAATDIGIFNAE